MKHTPEPWELVGYSLHGYQDRYISYLDGCDEKDARRIVACVNACAGIETERLESGSPEWWGRYVRDDRPAMEREIARLRADADRLAEVATLAAEIRVKIEAVERREKWKGGEPELVTCLLFGTIKKISDKPPERSKR